MRTRTATVVAVLAAVGLMVSLAVVWSRLGPEPTVREPGPGPATSAGTAGTSQPRVSGRPEVGRSDARPRAQEDGSAPRPVRATMPSIRFAATVRPVGVAPDGQMRIPPDPKVLGWYRFGATPSGGTGGSVVLAGHLDTKRFGLGPLVRLRESKPGDPVEVTMSDGTRTTYRVSDVERYDRQGLPGTLFARTGPEVLRVITCGGEYDAQAGGYQKNLVVTAVPERSGAPGER